MRKSWIFLAAYMLCAAVFMWIVLTGCLFAARLLSPVIADDSTFLAVEFSIMILGVAVIFYPLRFLYYRALNSLEEESRGTFRPYIIFILIFLMAGLTYLDPLSLRFG